MFLHILISNSWEKSVTVNIKRLSDQSPSNGQIMICRADSWRRRHAAPQLSALQMIIWLLDGANTADS